MRVRWRWVLVVTAALVLLAAGWTAWTAYRVNQDLSAAAQSADRLETAVKASDDPAADRALADLQEQSRSAADRTSGLTWRMLGHAPVVGDDADGVGVVSDVIADLSDDGIDQLLTVSDDLTDILPRNGRIPLDRVDQLQEPVSQGSVAFTDAEARLDAVDPSTFVDRLRIRYRDLAERVDDAARALRAADTAVSVMPTMLGQDGPKHYLLVFQNNAEVRSTGGLPGAVSLVTADDGKVEMTRQVAANSFGERATPVLPLSSPELQIYGEQLGTYFLDANFTPDFPRAADLMRARWQEVYGGDLDGVISLDPVALSYVLEATGPVKVGSSEINAENAVDVLLHQVYVDNPSPAAQDAFFRQVARTVFDRVSRGVSDPVKLSEALSRAAREHRINVASFDQEVRPHLDETAVAGRLTTGDSPGPQVGVYLNDGTGSKMSYYLRYDAKVSATWCSGGVQGLSGTLSLTSQAPKDAARLPSYITGGGAFGTDPGNQLVNVRIYGPVEGEISDVQMDSRPIRDISAVLQDDRLVATIPVELSPGETADLTWRMKSGPDQTGATSVDVTPSVVPGQSSSTVVSACA